MAWTVEISETAAREIERLDRSIQRRIVRFLRHRVATDEDPRRMGKRLQGARQGQWRYRVGDYRLICQIQDARITVLVLMVGHRRDIYRS